ncbi:hypothetical protein BX600DRAFT_289982 [Xylariales sp. PMI_506]|nr:hypothetical protein BX600DRAFT_289982 [Xylariales sp. PMI_506]
MPTPLDNAMRSKNAVLGVYTNFKLQTHSLVLPSRPPYLPFPSFHSLSLLLLLLLILPLHILRSANTIYSQKGFAGLVTAVSVWAIWGGDMFPAAEDPKGNPESWTREEMRRWLAARNLHPQDRDTREQLLERVKANMR